MTDLDKIKDKIRKLFALSKSPNAAEAALALEMAQKLMIEHNISRNAVGEFEVGQENIRAPGGEKPPVYEVYLMSQTAESFGCRTAYGLTRFSGQDGYGSFYFCYKFVGLEHRVKIASFIAAVLLRKLRKARSGYIKTLNRVRLRAHKTARADEFCLGWSITVAGKLHAFANSHEEQAAVDGYIFDLGWKNTLEMIKRKEIKSRINDYMNGREAGAGVEIQHGVEGQAGGARLLEA